MLEILGQQFELNGDRGVWRKRGGSRLATREEVAMAQLLMDSPGQETPSGSGKISLNRAPKDVLVLLPGIGEARAKQIIEARPIASIQELEEKGVELTTEAKRLVEV